MSFVASANCALFVGARPVFADIDAATANLDLAAADGAGLLDRVSACVIVSMAGLPADLAPLQAARRRGVVVIEDGCHALGALRDGHPVGSGLADMTAFSFHPVKAITTGEGGMVTTDSDELAARLRAFRTHGIRRPEPTEDPLHGGWHYEIDALGFNYRITDIQCALGHSQLTRLGEFHRRAQRDRRALPRAAGRRTGHRAPGSGTGRLTPRLPPVRGALRGGRAAAPAGL